MDAAGEFVDVRALAAEVEDADLGIGYTTIEPRLRVWLWKGMSASASGKPMIESVWNIYGDIYNTARGFPEPWEELLTLFLQYR